ncbi:hypothetical protein M513_07014 [Trichuris suis]|uniref:DDE-1 domain-containing protein n=1 Tax=Trichuris suis TaxID=68888 RepID=A0A085M4M3_9BILA|nr:hypothetical protein M513_07014 [Trichuris suis]
MRYRRTGHQSKLLPANVTSLTQPMDQGAIATLKRLYPKERLRYFLLSQNSSIGSVICFYKKMTLEDCRFMIAESWNTNREEDEVAEILDTLKHFSILDERNMTDTNTWLACDEDAGIHVLNDDEIVATVSQTYAVSQTKEKKKSSTMMKC